MFDIVAASALCERPDLELSSLFIGLSCLQHLAALLHNNLAAAAAAVAEVPGAAAEEEVNVKQVQADIVLVAARLEALARDAQSPEVAGELWLLIRGWVRLRKIYQQQGWRLWPWTRSRLRSRVSGQLMNCYQRLRLSNEQSSAARLAVSCDQS